MKNNLFIFFLVLSLNLYSQESTPKDSLWSTKGNLAVLLNQTGFSDWVGGGTNNFSGTIKFDYEVDEELIGGLKLQLGSFMIDTSIKNKLKKYKQAMLES